MSTDEPNEHDPEFGDVDDDDAYEESDDSPDEDE